MKLRKIQLENFRCYSNYSYDFTDDITVLIGPNGRGKTNFLEAIFILSLGKSFRTSTREDLIEWEQDYMRCTGDVSMDDDSTLLEVFYSRKPRKLKNFKKNDVKLKNSEFLGNLLTVLFNPEDLNILYLSPSYRRKYMDILLSQTSKQYLLALSSYNRSLKQRNALLSEIRECKFSNQNTATLLEDLDTWDAEIIKFGSQIYEKRTILVNFLQKNLEKLYQSISGSNEKVSIVYKNDFEEYSEKLSQRRERDIRYAKTSLGPHLDDLIFYLNDQEISSSASRGEYRSLILAIKLSEIDFIKQETGRNPILLLDDVFSELDKKRQKHLVKSIQNCQTIITTTDIDNLKELQEEKANITFVKIK